MTQRNDASLAPLTTGRTVAIIGGGPGGIACALSLQREAALRGIAIRTLVFEAKRFGMHYNQCSGVLSPPLPRILKDYYDIDLPERLIQREIKGYVLHAEDDSIVLRGSEYDGVSLAVRRAEFDEFLESRAREHGVEMVPTRVTDLEFCRDGVTVFAWGSTVQADVIVGAFGLGRGMTAGLAQVTPYRPPRVLETLVTKLHPAGQRAFLPGLLDDHIHVLLPPLPRVEFGALIPKGDHITVVVAGSDLRQDDADAFLALRPVRRLLQSSPDRGDYFKGRFPIGLARSAYGDRYVTVGDAAGLVRPFKGKGVNSAIITADRAARTMIERGISAEAFRGFYRDCRDITGDVLYGTLMRHAAGICAHHFSVSPAIRLAQRDEALRELLFDCVSGRETYRRIVLRKGNLPLAARVGLATVLGSLRHGGNRQTVDAARDGM